jgi:hypothetical protein
MPYRQPETRQLRLEGSAARLQSTLLGRLINYTPPSACGSTQVPGKVPGVFQKAEGRSRLATLLAVFKLIAAVPKGLPNRLLGQQRRFSDRQADASLTKRKSPEEVGDAPLSSLPSERDGGCLVLLCRRDEGPGHPLSTKGRAGGKLPWGKITSRIPARSFSAASRYATTATCVTRPQWRPRSRSAPGSSARRLSGTPAWPSAAPANSLELLSQWFPIRCIQASHFCLLIAQRPAELAACEIRGGRQPEERPFPRELHHDIGICFNRRLTPLRRTTRRPGLPSTGGRLDVSGS